MIQLAHHNEQLKSQFDSYFRDVESTSFQEAICLDSIDLVLRQCLNIEEMREAGSFFTGQHLASLLFSRFTKRISFDSVVVDPTCGAGNLLIECSRHLDVDVSLSTTLEKWGKVLCGYDIHRTFVEAARLRLIIEALNRGAKKDCTLNEALKFLPNIKVADVMSLDKNELNDVTHIAMNPPFCLWPSPQKGFWKKGKVNAAGVVFEHIVNILPRLCQVSAILPDVLRSGSRYSNWRDYVTSIMYGTCEIHGRFSSKADVDVFLLSGEIKASQKNNIEWYDNNKTGAVLSDYYNVCVGSLVAYRDPLIGEDRPFIQPKNAPAWEIIKKIKEYRRYNGKVYKPPFVVVRRTSSPSDKYRAVGTIIQGRELVAVENHMLVVQPIDGSLSSCKLLLNLLKCPETNDFLNNRIRLRHLTVGVVKQIPLWQGFY
jgi:hypothetical protein